MNATQAEINAVNKNIYAKEKELLELKEQREKLRQRRLSEYLAEQLRAIGFRGTCTIDGKEI